MLMDWFLFLDCQQTFNLQFYQLKGQEGVTGNEYAWRFYDLMNHTCTQVAGKVFSARYGAGLQDYIQQAITTCRIWTIDEAHHIAIKGYFSLTICFEETYFRGFCMCLSCASTPSSNTNCRSLSTRHWLSVLQVWWKGPHCCGLPKAMSLLDYGRWRGECTVISGLMGCDGNA